MSARIAACLGITLLAACELDRAGTLAEPPNPPPEVGGSAGAGGSPIAGAGGVAGRGWGGGTGGAGATAGASSMAGSAGAGAAGAGGVTWTPSDDSDCVLWLDADDSSTLTLEGDSVTAWQDKCRNGNASATANQAPQLALLGGRTAVRCDGIDDALTLGTPPILCDDYTLFFAVSKNFVTPYQVPLWSNRTLPLQPPPGGTVTYLGFEGRAFLYQNQATPVSLKGATDHTLTTFSFVYEVVVSPNGERQLLIDGAVEASSNGTKTATNLATGVLCADPAATHFGPFDVHEVIMFCRALPPSDRQSAREHLASKWGF